MTSITPPVETAATVITGNAAAETATVEGAQAAVDQGRQYVVLRLIDSGCVDVVAAGQREFWESAGTFDGSNADEAVRKAAADDARSEAVDTTGELTYVAVPSRSFQLRSLTVKVEPRIEFGSRS